MRIHTNNTVCCAKCGLRLGHSWADSPVIDNPPPGGAETFTLYWTTYGEIQGYTMRYDFCSVECLTEVISNLNRITNPIPDTPPNE